MSGSDVKLKQLRVQDVMNEEVVFVRTSDSLAQAAAALDRHQVSGVPVIDEFGHCVGVLSVTDFRREYQAAGQEDGGMEHNLDARVGDLMTTPPVAVVPQMPLSEAGLLMCSRHVHRLPVVTDDGLLAGMISSLDLVASMVGTVTD